MKQLPHFLFLAVFGFTPIAFSQTAATTQPAETGQHPASFEGTITFKLNYLLFLPQEYDNDPGKKWPLIVFLHGSGERGNDVNMVKAHGRPKSWNSRRIFRLLFFRRSAHRIRDGSRMN
jgi:predicted peptidase